MLSTFFLYFNAIIYLWLAIYDAFISLLGGNFYELQGRHIEDINYLIEGLIRGCHSCKEPLRLSSCIGDTSYGLGIM